MRGWCTEGIGALRGSAHRGELAAPRGARALRGTPQCALRLLCVVWHAIVSGVAQIPVETACDSHRDGNFLRSEKIEIFCYCG